MTDPVSVPLGFWLRTVDGLLESSMNEVLATQGLTRHLWQVLNTVERNAPASTHDVAEAMAVSLGGDSVSSGGMLDDLERRGWIAASEDAWSLTDDGRFSLAGLERMISDHRKVMFDKIDDADYRTTVETLAQIVENLDPERARTRTFR